MTDSREQLLDIAQDLFGQQGIAATPMSAIARQAGISAAMMHYYFNNRDQLLDVLVEERIVPVMSMLATDLSTLDNPSAFLQAMAERIVERVSHCPWLPGLWVREILSEGGLLRSRIITRFGGSLHAKLLEKLRQWHAEGRLPSDLDPGLLLVSVIGVTIFPLAAAGIWRHLPGMSTVPPETLQRHAIALLLHGIASPEGSKQ